VVPCLEAEGGLIQMSEDAGTLAPGTVLCHCKHLNWNFSCKKLSSAPTGTCSGIRRLVQRSDYYIHPSGLSSGSPAQHCETGQGKSQDSTATSRTVPAENMDLVIMSTASTFFIS